MTLATNGLNNAKIYKWTYADAAARTGFQIFSDADSGSLAIQLDDNSLWMLTGSGSYSWVPVGSAGGGVLPTAHTLFPFNFTRGNTSADPPYNIPNRGDMIFNMWTEPQGGISEGEQFWIDIPLAAGDYTLAVTGSKGENRGSIQWDLDGTDFGSVEDWYDPSDQPNARFIEPFTAPAGGMVRLRWTMVTKNVDAIDNAFFLTVLWINPA